MKVMAQCGFGPSDKLSSGFEKGVIDGVIFSPRYAKPEKVSEYLNELKHEGRPLLLDPEFYATDYLGNPTAKLGALEEWPSFRPYRRSALITGTPVSEIIKNCVADQLKAGFSECITPNVYINSADSINTGIALNFIIASKEKAIKEGAKTVYATLALDRDVFLNKESFVEIIDALTGIESAPDGYYLIVGCSESNSNSIRSDLYDSDVIAGLMYTNYALALNGARIINGYSHLLAPLVGICGATGAASGWHSGLRQFSIKRYSDDGRRGKIPLIRYLSTPLLAHITHAQYRDFTSVLPEIASGTELDKVFDAEEPTRTEEALQSWEALNKFNNSCITGRVTDDLNHFAKHLEKAISKWKQLQGAGFSRGVDAYIEQLESIMSGIELFKRMAELV